MAKGRFGRHNMVKKHKARPVEVNGLPFGKLQEAIKYRGNVMLHITGELDDCLLTDYEWPENSGVVWYCCVASGLLFDRQTGRCKQAETVSLAMESLVPFVADRTFYRKWTEERRKRQSFDWIKPAKEQEDDDEYAAVE